MRYIEIKSEKNILRGMVHDAFDDRIERKPIVLVHGYFSANKIGPQRLFVKISNFLSQYGYTVYRFDLSGMGESDGDIKCIKFSNHVQDMHNIISYVKTIHQDNKISIISHCIGCNISIEIIKREIDFVDNIIFLAPFFSNFDVLKKFFGVEQYQELITKSFTYRNGLYSDYSFFDENTEDDFIQDIALIKPRVIDVILPEKDQFIPSMCSMRVFEKVKNLNLHVIKNADHNFLETQQEVLNVIASVLNLN